jgi:protein O-GlcNAc transferase
MTDAARAPRAPFPYRASFLVGCALLAASCTAGLFLAVTGRDGVPALDRFDAHAVAEAREDSGDLSGAARELHMRSLIDPSDCASFEALGEILAQQGDLEGSLRVRLRHVSIHPYSSAAHTSLGLAFERLARHAEAYGSFSMAVRLNRGDATALAALGDIARGYRRLDEAIAFYERALPFGVQTAQLHNKLAISHALAGHRERARRHFGEALSLDPDYTEARTNLELLAGMGEASPPELR